MQRSSTMFNRHAAIWLYALLMFAGRTTQASALDPDMRGDFGLGAYYARSIVKGQSNKLSLLPYADFNYGRFFARVDTLGARALPMGYGYLELIGRVSQDGYRTDAPVLNGLAERKTSLPLGVGTLQVTPMGGFYINAFNDMNKSKGNLLEAIYGTKFELSPVTFYPMFGAEYQSGAYVRYYYGISEAEAAASVYAVYRPGSATNIFAALIADFQLSEEYHLNLYIRHKRLGEAIRLSPLVEQNYLDTAYIALSYRFR